MRIVQHLEVNLAASVATLSELYGHPGSGLPWTLAHVLEPSQLRGVEPEHLFAGPAFRLLGTPTELLLRGLAEKLDAAVCIDDSDSHADLIEYR